MMGAWDTVGSYGVANLSSCRFPWIGQLCGSVALWALLRMELEATVDREREGKREHDRCCGVWSARLGIYS